MGEASPRPVIPQLQGSFSIMAVETLHLVIFPMQAWGESLSLDNVDVFTSSCLLRAYSSSVYFRGQDRTAAADYHTIFH